MSPLEYGNDKMHCDAGVTVVTPTSAPGQVCDTVAHSVQTLLLAGYEVTVLTPNLPFPARVPRPLVQVREYGYCADRLAELLAACTGRVILHGHNRAMVEVARTLPKTCIRVHWYVTGEAYPYRVPPTYVSYCPWAPVDHIYRSARGSQLLRLPPLHPSLVTPLLARFNAQPPVLPRNKQRVLDKKRPCFGILSAAKPWPARIVQLAKEVCSRFPEIEFLSFSTDIADADNTYVLPGSVIEKIHAACTYADRLLVLGTGSDMSLEITIAAACGVHVCIFPGRVPITSQEWRLPKELPVNIWRTPLTKDCICSALENGLLAKKTDRTLDVRVLFSFTLPESVQWHLCSDA